MNHFQGQEHSSASSYKSISPNLATEMRYTHRALSAFFSDVSKEEKLLQQQQQISPLKRRSNPEKTDIQQAQQKMFNDLYQRIQVRRHLGGSFSQNGNNIFSSANSSLERNSGHHSLCQSFIDADTTLSTIKSDSNCCSAINNSSTNNNNNNSNEGGNNASNSGGRQGVASPSSTETSVNKKGKAKKGHLWKTLKFLQCQNSQKKERVETEHNNNTSNYSHREEQIVYSNKVRKPKLKLQIKSVSFQRKTESNRQNSLQASSNQQSILSQDKNSNPLPKQDNYLDENEKKKNFNVFYDHDDFMSSRYQSFKTRFENLKQQCQNKSKQSNQESNSLNSSPLKQQNNHTNQHFLSTPAKRSRATTQESTTSNTLQMNSNNNNNNTLVKPVKIESTELPQISVFSTSPEIINISPVKRKSANEVASSLNLQYLHSDLDLQQSNYQSNDLNNSISNNSLNNNSEQQVQQKPKKKIILKTKYEASGSKIMQGCPTAIISGSPTTSNAKKIVQNLNQLSYSTSPVKEKTIQIQKLSSTRKVIFSQKNSTLNLTESSEETKKDFLQSSEKFFQNEIFSSTAKYLESRKNFIFSKALLQRDRQKFEKDCQHSQSFYQSSK